MNTSTALENMTGTSALIICVSVQSTGVILHTPYPNILIHSHYLLYSSQWELWGLPVILYNKVYLASTVLKLTSETVNTFSNCSCQKQSSLVLISGEAGGGGGMLSTTGP